MVVRPSPSITVKSLCGSKIVKWKQKRYVEVRPLRSSEIMTCSKFITQEQNRYAVVNLHVLKLLHSSMIKLSRYSKIVFVLVKLVRV